MNYLKEIEEARIEILKIKPKKLCSKCSAEIENGALFCPKCGVRSKNKNQLKKRKLLKS